MIPLEIQHSVRRTIDRSSISGTSSLSAGQFVELVPSLIKNRYRVFVVWTVRRTIRPFVHIEQCVSMPKTNNRKNAPTRAHRFQWLLAEYSVAQSCLWRARKLDGQITLRKQQKVNSAQVFSTLRTILTELGHRIMPYPYE